MLIPAETSTEDVFGGIETMQAIKIITLAPELKGSQALIEKLSQRDNVVVCIGHSNADFETGLAALRAGARSLTHVFNAMNPLHHRSPGLAGLIASPQAPYFSLIGDGIHLHPAILTMAFRSQPRKCILITDSIEMAGLPDGIYPGHAQIPRPQRKEGNRVTIDGTETLIGSCSSIDECVRNLLKWSGCSLPEAVACATENIVNMLGDVSRGMIEAGRRADFVVMDDQGQVLQTWIKGVQVYDKS